MLFEDKEVEWEVMDITIHGTITSPSDIRRNSAIVFVAGSGPTDRNWCSPLLPCTNGTAKILAEELAKLGYLTLRYDKMASGPFVRENFPKFSQKASMRSHVEELKGAVDAISNELGNNCRLYALTNSEGAIHAVNYQIMESGKQFNGMILTGAPGRSVGEMARSQLVYQLKTLPNAAEILEYYDISIMDFVAGKPIRHNSSMPQGIEMLLKSLETPANLPFSRELWEYRLSDNIAKIKVPVLVLIGKKDIQSDWQVDGGALEEAAKTSPNISFVYPKIPIICLNKKTCLWKNSMQSMWVLIITLRKQNLIRKLTRK
ncbi:MAG: alpha/beta hydrolase [Thermoplasmata archaeon]